MVNGREEEREHVTDSGCESLLRPDRGNEGGSLYSTLHMARGGRSF